MQKAKLNKETGVEEPSRAQSVIDDALTTKLPSSKIMLSKIEIQAKSIQSKFTGNAGKQLQGMMVKDIIGLKKNQKDFLQNQACIKSSKITQAPTLRKQ